MAALTATSLVLVLGTSVVIGVGLALSSGWIAHRTLYASPELIPEATAAIVWLAASLPFVLLATVLAAPLAVLPWTRNLAVLTAVVGALRVANAAALVWLALRVVPTLRLEPRLLSMVVLARGFP